MLRKIKSEGKKSRIIKQLKTKAEKGNNYHGFTRRLERNAVTALRRHCTGFTNTLSLTV